MVNLCSSALGFSVVKQLVHYLMNFCPSEACLEVRRFPCGFWLELVKLVAIDSLGIYSLGSAACACSSRAAQKESGAPRHQEY